ncbi:MAG: 3-oxoacyl-ACP reductase FabG [Candidatus Hodarchaeales archaeon]|jgi:3-oxoacyl-[acyl-carrier protein] reductase
MKFKNEVVVITGAGRGIGFEIARQFLLKGAKIVVIDLDTERWVQSLHENKIFSEENLLVLKTDITKFGSLKEKIKEIIEKFGKINILVNNAGVNRDGLMLKMSIEDWDTVFNVNLKATFLITQIIANYMKDNNINGKIVNVISTAGKHGNFGQSNYAASKAGLFAFTKSIARELARFNIRVNAVMPGLVDTPMTKSMNQEIKEKRIKEIPLQRMGEPIDVANAVLFLASSNASYITGSVIQVDGGLRM